MEIDKLQLNNEQLSSDNEQLNSDNRKLLQTLMESYKEVGLSKESAITKLKQKLPNISSELAESVAAQIFK